MTIATVMSAFTRLLRAARAAGTHVAQIGSRRGFMAVTTAAIAAPMAIAVAEEEEGEVEAEGDGEGQSLDELAQAMEDEQAKANLVKPPMAYENVEGVLGGTYVDTFDGIRMQVQKQINLNTVVSHFYWLGSSQRPPFYRYSMILADPVDGTRLTVHTEDITNINGDLSAQVNDNVGVKADFSMTDKGNTYTTTCNMNGSTSVGQVQFAFDPNSFGGHMFGGSFMQALTKELSMGGQSMYIAQKGVLINSFAGVYDDGDNCLAAQYGGGMSSFKAMYMRRVNPNRVTLATGLVVDQEGNSTMDVSAEYSFKQSTLKMSASSDMMLKSSLQSRMSPGVEFHLSAEVLQAKDHFKFGYSIIMG